MRTGIRAPEVRILCHLWCSNASLLHLSVSSNAISVRNWMYFIAPGFGTAQLRVSFALVKELTHDTRLFCVFVAATCLICLIWDRSRYEMTRFLWDTPVPSGDREEGWVARPQGLGCRTGVFVQGIFGLALLAALPLVF